MATTATPEQHEAWPTLEELETAGIALEQAAEECMVLSARIERCSDRERGNRRATFAELGYAVRHRGRLELERTMIDDAVKATEEAIYRMTFEAEAVESA